MGKKKPKKIQTDYTRGGKAISDTAIPLYKENLLRMDNYLDNPQALQDKYLQDYFLDTQMERDLNRQYKRNMAQMTGSNYNATTGGFASQNQKNYDDLQRDYNDYFARLQDQGVMSAYNMASNDYQNMLAANPYYNQAYGLGRDYSDIQQYNNMADQYNKNSWLGTVGQGLSAVGQGVSMLPGWGKVIGAGMQFAGGAMASQAPEDFGNDYRSGTQGVSQNMFSNAGQALGTGLDALGKKYNWLGMGDATLAPVPQQQAKPEIRDKHW